MRVERLRMNNQLLTEPPGTMPATLPAWRGVDQGTHGLRVVNAVAEQTFDSEAALKSRLLLTDFTKIDDHLGTIVLSSFLLRQLPCPKLEFPNVTGTLYEQWLDETVRRGQNVQHGALLNWLLVAPPKYVLYLIFLFNSRYGETWKVLRRLLKSEKKNPPPYLFRVIPNILLHYYPADEVASLVENSGDLERWAPYIRELTRSAEKVEKWLAEKAQPIRFYGGKTNTVLGMYDAYFDDKTGAKRLNPDADVYYDLGGGYNTPEIRRLTGFPFISADLNSPRLEEHDSRLLLVRKVAGKEVALPEAERAEYLKSLRETPYLKFDVFENAFPESYDSYVIASTGFLTSTVRPNVSVSGFERNGDLLTSAMAVWRVLRLVQLGKDVDLFTIQRATKRPYAYKTVFLQFRAGRVATLVVTGDRTIHMRFSENHRATIRKMIDPATSPFRRFVDMPEAGAAGREEPAPFS